jgi:hypothetical protein
VIFSIITKEETTFLHLLGMKYEIY